MTDSKDPKPVIDSKDPKQSAASPKKASVTSATPEPDTKAVSRKNQIAAPQAPEKPKPSPTPKPVTNTSANKLAELIPAKHLSPKDPDSETPPPGIAPPGDSRSLRREREGVEEFVLIYRNDANIIRRQGVVGKEGRWNCVQYPTLGAAAHAYAQECSELTGQGYRDLRE